MATDTPQSASDVSPVQVMGAVLGFFAGAVALALLLIAHAVGPDLNPVSHALSEYALGQFGWVQTFWFAALAVGCIGAILLVWRENAGVLGWGGITGLAAAATGLAMAACFPMDTLGTSPEHASLSNQLHGIAAMIGIPGFLMGSLLTTLAVGNLPLWVESKRPLMAAAHLFWVSFALTTVAVVSAIWQAPEANWIGVPNRLLGIAYSLWLMALSWPALRTAAIK